MKTYQIILIGMILLGLILGCGCASQSNKPITTTTQQPVTQNIQVKVTYGGSWSGALGAGGNVKTIDGTGPMIYNIDNPGYFVSINAQKKDDSHNRLTVEILKNGKVIASEFTDAAYGVAMTSSSI